MTYEALASRLGAACKTAGLPMEGSAQDLIGRLKKAGQWTRFRRAFGLPPNYRPPLPKVFE